jgi:arylformamidase
VNSNRWIDISWPIEEGALLHPEDPPPVVTRYSDMAAGDDYNLTQVTLSLHTGTHFDAPRHFVKDGATIDALPLETFVTVAHVVDLGRNDSAEVRHLEPLGVQRGEAVLFKRWNATLPRDKMAERWVYVSADAARWCVAHGVSILGADYIEVESPDTPHGQYPVHETLLPAGVLLLENLDLSQAGAGRYRLICPPIKFAGCEGAPCRAMLGPLEG